MSDHIVNATDQDFDQQVLQSDKPVLVDFWAGWCAPCKAIAPVLEDLAEEYADKLKVVKLDVTGNGDTAAKYGIRNIPALIMFKDGKPVAQQVGAVPRSQLTSFINQNLG